MNKDPYEITTEFGFSFETSDEDIKEELTAAKENVAHLLSSVYNLQSMIHPLLDNLMKDPEKDTIKWPNRAEKVQEFKDKIDAYVGQVKDGLLK